ncbi:MAG: hypothetical protein IPK20_00930 [Betaproteobacteria bacterium]|nr:hypothetical protein [Betaproteobacteria bacterium]
MDRTPLLDLVAELLAAIRLLTGYPIPDRLPEIHVVPPAEIQRLLCKSNCGIKAFYHPDKGHLRQQYRRPRQRRTGPLDPAA